MTESVEKSSEYFKYPDIEAEIGEFERVADTFGIDSSVLMFLAHEGQMTYLDFELWNKLENTDSNTFDIGDWEWVHEHSNPDGEHKRDWESLKDKVERGKVLNAPIIMKYGNKYHLVSGNTRLMVARAKGVVPKVLLFEIDQSFDSL